MRDDRPIPPAPMAGLRFDGFDEDGNAKWSTIAENALAAEGARPLKVTPPSGSSRPPHSHTPPTSVGLHDMKLKPTPIFQRHVKVRP